MRLGVECGGTFTDFLVLRDDGQVLYSHKVFSTPSDPARAVVAGLEDLTAAGCDFALIDDFYHGSTVATNALLERKGPKVGLLTTKGFEDVVFIQRQDRSGLYDLSYQKPVPLVEPSGVVGVAERIDAQGRVLVPLDEHDLRLKVETLAEDGVAAFAVVLLHSYRNALHEARIRELIAAWYPDAAVSLSSDVVPEFREYERTSTTIVEAFIRPAVRGYVGRLEHALKSRGVTSLEVMQSNGGVVPAPVVAAHPISMLLSGPAAGVAGALAVAGEAGYKNIVTMDMGGTSTDVCLARAGVAELTTETTVAGLPIRLPMIDIHSLGAGGGSIVSVDSGGLLKIGPESAGSDPGPACYGRGSSIPTVTDANVALGLIRTQSFLGGSYALDLDASLSALEAITNVVGGSCYEVANDARQLASTLLAGAVRVVSVERGHDVSDYALVAFGGAGPLHAADVAGELGISQVIIPPNPALASAYGLLASGFRREFSMAVNCAADLLDRHRLTALMDDLEQAGRESLSREGIDLGGLSLSWLADLRYRGQGFELMVPIESAQRGDPSALVQGFHRLHQTRFGHADVSRVVDVVTLRLGMSTPSKYQSVPKLDVTGPPSKTVAPVWQDGQVVDLPFYSRASLPVSWSDLGPLVIEDGSSATFVPATWRVTVDQNTNLILSR